MKVSELIDKLSQYPDGNMRVVIRLDNEDELWDYPYMLTDGVDVGEKVIVLDLDAPDMILPDGQHVVDPVI
jgi:hypothetical protein